MPVSGFDAAVAICGLGECSLLPHSMWLCGWVGPVLKLCVGWRGKLASRVVDRMLCTRVLMPHHANEKVHYSTRAQCSESYNY